MPTPLVTVICVCYNHSRFVNEALDSVINQTYPNIELIVIDDGSTDGSGKVIKKWVMGHPQVTFILNAKNIGYCKTFNKAWHISKGDLIIDLAADDILIPERVELGVKLLEQGGVDFGVTFSDAVYINEQGKELSRHSDKYPHETVPQGDIYKEVIERYFICSPTIMFKRSVLTSLQGYDESLAFEDFDFWVRASRNFRFIYSPEVLVKKRIVDSSMSASQFDKSSPQRWSTHTVCEKIKFLNKTAEENNALKKRLRYEIGVSLQAFDFKLVRAFWKLYRSI